MQQTQKQFSGLAPLPSNEIGALVYPKNVVNGQSIGGVCGYTQPSFWSNEAPAFDCGFSIDTSRAMKYGCMNGCGPLACNCNAVSMGCDPQRGSIDGVFQDIMIDRPLDFLYGDALPRENVLSNTKLSGLYGLRCDEPVGATSPCGVGPGQGIYQSQYGPESLYATVRTHVGP